MYGGIIAQQMQDVKWLASFYSGLFCVFVFNLHDFVLFYAWGWENFVLAYSGGGIR